MRTISSPWFPSHSKICPPVIEREKRRLKMRFYQLILLTASSLSSCSGVAFDGQRRQVFGVSRGG